MVQAGRLVSIEDALAGMGGDTPTRGRGDTATPKPAPARNTSPPLAVPSAAPKVQAAPSPAPTAPAPPPGIGNSSWRDKLHTTLMELGMEFTADAIEHSEVVEANGELRFTTPKEFSIAMREADINQAVRRIAGKPLKIKVTIGDVAAQ